ncbi:hypothetical protein [Desulfofundulus sp. TPOSR]|uniref:hypothetical protein n=1 Tax=Desulfofundulus sp. TPOSR TaxID=2714340 RepID=UPI0028BE0188|nr:hypothetical protein [Desulfofundulus sp. TPOSR]
MTVSGGTPEARGPPAPSAGQAGVPGLSESVNCFCYHFYRYLIEVDSKNETEAHTPVILGEPGDEALLGVVTLEILGLVLNPFNRILQPMRVAL